MTNVVISGIAVLDYVFKVDAFPRTATKYLTNDAAVSLGGCAANAALAIARLGGQAHLATRLGDDQVGAQIVSILKAAGVSDRYVDRQAAVKSSFSSIFVDAEGERQIVHYRDDQLKPDAGHLASRLTGDFDAALADTRWPEAAGVLMTLARECGKPGVLDAEANDDGLETAFMQSTHVAFSAEGLRDYTGNPHRESALRLADRILPGWVCVTDGPQGVFYMQNGEYMHTPAFKVDAVDTLGAGDIWHGAFALHLAEHSDEAEAVRYANAVAAIKCTRFGGSNGTPDRAEVEKFLVLQSLTS